MAVTIPPDTRAIGTGNPPVDMDDVSDVLNAFGIGYNIQDTQWAGGADPTGGTACDAAILACLAAGKAAYLPPGTYLVSGNTALAMTTGGQRISGAGYGLTKVQVGGSFSGPEVFSIGAGNCQVDNLSIIGASSTITSNPACNGIEVQPGSYQYTIHNVFTQYINGYSLEGSNNGSSPDISHSVVDKFWSYNCAGAIHYNGDQATVGVTLSNISIGGGGAASGANANLDAIFIQDAFDLVFSGLLIGVGNAGTGNCIHIKGNCSAVFFNGFDAGGYPEPLASSQCGLLIEDDGTGNAERIRFSHGIFQTFGEGAKVSGLAQQIGFSDVQFVNNVTHGCELAGSGTQVNFSGCTFSGNGSGGTGNNYDLNNSGTAQGTVRDCHFLTATGITAGSGPGVQNTIGMSAGGTALNFENCDFLGTSSGIGTIFQNLPAQVRSCKNYNPHGAVTFSVPASGSAGSALHYDSMQYITAANVAYPFTATSASPCVFTATGSAYANGTQVMLTGTSLPAGFTAGTSYFVVAASGTSFELAATSGGSAVNSTSTGAGTVAAVCSILRNTNGNGGGVGPTVTIPPGQTVAVFVRAGANITPTYTQAPTWAVDGM